MFICLDCHNTFDTPITLSEKMGEYMGVPAWDYYGACPYCHSDQIDTLGKCDICGEEIEDGLICQACAEKVGDMAHEFLNKVQEMANKYGLNFDELLYQTMKEANR